MGTRASDQAANVQAARTPVDRDFRALFDAEAAYVAASLGRLGVAPNDREDLVVEVFVRVHRELSSYDATRPLRPWIFAFAARVASEHRRLARHRREVIGEGPEVASTKDAPDRVLEAGQARHIVEIALEELDDDKRAVVVLHDLDETPIPEVARALGIAEGTAYSRLRAGRAELTSAVRRLALTKKGAL